MAKKKKMTAADRARRRAANHTSGGASTTLKLPGGVEFFSPKKGKYLVDILSYPVGKGNPWCEEGELYFERTYFVHRNIGIENKSYICPRLTAEKRCPVCEYRAKLLKEGADKDLVTSLKPQERQLWNVIDPDNRKSVMLWDISTFCFGLQLDGEINECDEDENYGSFSDLKDGFTLKLGVDQEAGQGFTFLKVNRVGFKARKTDYDEEVLERLYNLDDMLIILEYDKLNKIFLQMASDEKEEVEEEEEDAPTPPKKKKKAKPAPEPEPEVDEDDPDDPEDDLDEPEDDDDGTATRGDEDDDDLDDPDDDDLDNPEDDDDDIPF